MHSYRVRRLRDLPRDELSVVLHLRVRRFHCVNPACPRHTFAEQIPGLTSARAQRTPRLTRALRAIGLALGGEAGQRLAHALAMPSSHDTVLRIVRATPPLDSPTPQVIGVDDWAIRKAVSYGTIIVDLETRRPFDLLPDRQADTLRDWLRQHHGITTIARDRSMEYAWGIQAGAPDATQVIDRWHLLKNLREATERLCNRVRGQVDTLWSTTPPRVSVYAQATQRYTNEVNASQAARARRLQQYEYARQLKAQGYNIRQIAQRVPLAMGTARKYYYAEQFPERKHHRRHASALDPFVEYLQTRFDQGCKNAMQLWREIRTRGYTRGPKAVRQWVRLRRARPAPTTPSAHRSLHSTATAAVADLPSTRALSWVLTRPPTALRDDERVMLSVLRQHELLGRAHDLVQRFASMMRERKGERLEGWIQDALTSDIKELKTFAAGLQPDQLAVHVAMTHPWSNGPTEGHVNRLKLIKRQMYGRAHFDLLRIRVLHASRSTKPA
ncbi:MAG: ISL3 family transposase [Chloroflexi bacterium]|nr:ISL3 family transposase [Chloroflexota bacterium]